MQNTTSSGRNYDEILFIFRLFNVEVFGKNTLADKRDADFMI